MSARGQTLVCGATARHQQKRYNSCFAEEVPCPSLVGKASRLPWRQPSSELAPGRKALNVGPASCVKGWGKTFGGSLISRWAGILGLCVCTTSFGAICGSQQLEYARCEGRWAGLLLARIESRLGRTLGVPGNASTEERVVYFMGLLAEITVARVCCIRGRRSLEKIVVASNSSSRSVRVCSSR